jgi:hypothetical protein
VRLLFLLPPGRYTSRDAWAYIDLLSSCLFVFLAVCRVLEKWWQLQVALTLLIIPTFARVRTLRGSPLLLRSCRSWKRGTRLLWGGGGLCGTGRICWLPLRYRYAPLPDCLCWVRAVGQVCYVLTMHEVVGQLLKTIILITKDLVFFGLVWGVVWCVEGARKGGNGKPRLPAGSAGRCSSVRGWGCRCCVQRGVTFDGALTCCVRAPCRAAFTIVFHLLFFDINNGAYDTLGVRHAVPSATDSLCFLAGRARRLSCELVRSEGYSVARALFTQCAVGHAPCTRLAAHRTDVVLSHAGQFFVQLKLVRCAGAEVEERKRLLQHKGV